MIRGLLELVGLALGGYGGWLLLDLGLTNLVATGVWLAGGVIAHDAVLAPVTIVGGLLLARVLSGTTCVAVVTGAVLLGPVTLLAVPVLGRFGAHGDLPSLLDRDYLTGWLVLAALIWTGVGAMSLVASPTKE